MKIDSLRGHSCSLNVGISTDPSENVALDWKSLRNIKECTCSRHFDHYVRKNHCWQCGDVLCDRCIHKHIALPGHNGNCAVPVCRPCYCKITNITSVHNS